MRLILTALFLGSLAIPATAQDLERGERLFQQWCQGCHGRTSEQNPTMPGTTPLAQKYGDSRPSALVDREDLTPEVISIFVRRGVSFMPFFRKTELSDEELADLAAWLAQAHRDR